MLVYLLLRSSLLGFLSYFNELGKCEKVVFRSEIVAKTQEDLFSFSLLVFPFLEWNTLSVINTC